MQTDQTHAQDRTARRPAGRPARPARRRGRGHALLSALLCVTLGVTVAAGTASASAADPEVAAADAAGVVMPNLDDVRGNLTLPATGPRGSNLTWTSSAPDLIGTDGVVRRPAFGEDPVDVTLRVTASHEGDQASATYVGTVTPLPQEEDLAGYFFPHFVGESTDDGESIYFAASQGNDPLSWITLNDGEPVLSSTEGEEGLRDPFIIRSPEGDRFFLLATDLKIYGGGDFGTAQERGSRSLMIWESDDLITWSEQREVVVSPPNAGNTWAPEAYWDEANGEYVVYWASALYPEDLPVEDREITDSYQRMMFATTRDFVTFSEPQVWIDERQGPGRGMIDSTVAEEDGVFYRLTKDESDFTVRQESSTELTRTQGVTEGDGWDMVRERIGVGQPNPWGGTFTQGEGPTMFRSNTDDTWYLLIDQPSYHGGQGYMLFETDDLASADWTSVVDAELPASPRHGTVLPVTASEYAALLQAYQPSAQVVSVADVALTVQVGDAPVLPATVATERGDGSTVDTAVTWDAVDPEDYATPGTFTVSGTLDAATELRATATVTVQTDAVPVQSLTVSPEQVRVTVGGTADLTATVTPANATARALTWTSADPAVATVDADGVVTGLAQGTTTVTVRTADAAFSVDVPVTVVPDSAPEIPAGAWVDTFDGPDLDPRWSVLRESADRWSLTDGSLQLDSLPGDTYQGDNTARNVFLLDVPAGDFTAYAKVDSTVVQNFQGAGIIAWADEDNYVRTGLTHASIAPGGPVVVESGAETAAFYTSTFAPRPGSTSEHLRVQRIGDQVSTSYWADDAWVVARTVTVGFDMTQIGLYALAAGGAAGHRVAFDYFALVEPQGADQVPEGAFSLRGDGDLEHLVATADGLALDDLRPLVQTALVATAVGEPQDGVAPVTLADSDSGRPVVVRGDRLVIGVDGDEPAVVRLTDAGGGTVLISTGERFVGVGEDGALVLGERASATALTIVPVTVEEHSITVDTAGERTPFSETMYGAFYEDINYAADGGLYAELVRNRSFEFDASDNASFTALTGWQPVERDGADGTVVVEDAREQWLNDNNRHHLTITSDGAGVGVRNTHFNTGLAVEQDAVYDFSVWARSATAQTLTVTVEDADGATTFATGTVAVDGSDEWKQYQVAVTAGATTSTGRLVVTGGDAGTLRLDMVSLFPQDTWVGPVNGKSPLRKDLAELVADLEPKFLRFPGGCVTNVGTFDTYLDSDGQDRRRTYQWKETVGPVEERPTNWNFWGYNQSYGLGYLEYMEWAEDLGASPLPVVSVGANGCGSTIPELTDEEGIERWVQDTVDLLEFAKGGTDTEWGARRAELGHPEPFDVRYIGLGNEENTDTFQANFPRFRDAVEAAWPDVTVISNTGPDDTGARFDELFQFNRDQDVAMQDEHYYNSPDWFLQNHRRYDAYDREADPDVFLGEYASQGNTHYNALAEAAYMTGLERNTDLVKLASYAPMFANEDYVQWTPANMMFFDNDEAWGTPNYYNQKMWMTVGADADEVVPSTLTSADDGADDLAGGAFLSTWSTRAAYDDVTVTDNETGEVLFSDDFDDASRWTPVSGSWSVVDGEYVQDAGTVNDARSIVTGAYDVDWTDYTLELDARKLSGAEGFLVGFAAGGPDEYLWWNLGGWNNTRSVLQRADGGSANELRALEGRSLVTGQDYRITVVVSGRTVELYLDDVLQLSYTQPAAESLYQVVTHDQETGTHTLKVVNPTAATARTSVALTGGVEIDPEVAITELVAAPGDVNTKADPTDVVPVERTWDGGAADFVYDFPAYSVTFLELTEAGPAVPSAADVLAGADDRFDLARAAVARVLAADPTSPVSVLTDAEAALTLFLPTDEAFMDYASDVDGVARPLRDEDAALAVLVGLPVDAVEQLLLYHVVPGRTLDSADVLAARDTALATAYQGHSITPRRPGPRGRLMIADEERGGRDAQVLLDLVDLNLGAPQQVQAVDRVLRPAGALP